MNWEDIQSAAGTWRSKDHEELLERTSPGAVLDHMAEFEEMITDWFADSHELEHNIVAARNALAALGLVLRAEPKSTLKGKLPFFLSHESSQIAFYAKTLKWRLTGQIDERNKLNTGAEILVRLDEITFLNETALGNPHLEEMLVYIKDLVFGSKISEASQELLRLELKLSRLAAADGV